MVGQSPCPGGHLEHHERALLTVVGDLVHPLLGFGCHRFHRAVIGEDHQAGGRFGLHPVRAFTEQQTGPKTIPDVRADRPEQGHLISVEGRIVFPPGQTHLTPRHATGTEHCPDLVAKAGRPIQPGPPDRPGQITVRGRAQRRHRDITACQIEELVDIVVNELGFDQRKMHLLRHALGVGTGDQQRLRVHQQPTGRFVPDHRADQTCDLLQQRQRLVRGGADPGDLLDETGALTVHA